MKLGNQTTPVSNDDFAARSGDSQLFARFGQQPVVDFSDKSFNQPNWNELEDNIRTLVIQRDCVDIRLHRPLESTVRERDKPHENREYT